MRRSVLILLIPPICNATISSAFLYTCYLAFNAASCPPAHVWYKVECEARSGHGRVATHCSRLGNPGHHLQPSLPPSSKRGPKNPTLTSVAEEPWLGALHTWPLEALVVRLSGTCAVQEDEEESEEGRSDALLRNRPMAGRLRPVFVVKEAGGDYHGYLLCLGPRVDRNERKEWVKSS